VVLKSTLEPFDPQGPSQGRGTEAVLAVSSTSDFLAGVSSRVEALTGTIGCFEQAGVAVLVSTEQLKDPIPQLCAERGIAVIDCIDDCDALLLCRVGGVSALDHHTIHSLESLRGALAN